MDFLSVTTPSEEKPNCMNICLIDVNNLLLQTRWNRFQWPTSCPRTAAENSPEPGFRHRLSGRNRHREFCLKNDN